VVYGEVGHARPAERLGQAQPVAPPQRPVDRAGDDVQGHLEHGAADLQPDVAHPVEVGQPGHSELGDREVERALVDVPVLDVVRVKAHPLDVLSAFGHRQVRDGYRHLGQLASDGLHLGVDVRPQVGVHLVDDERLDAFEQHRSHRADDALHHGSGESQILEVQLAVFELHVHLRLGGLQVAIRVRFERSLGGGFHFDERYVERARRRSAQPRPQCVVAQHVHSSDFQQHVHL